MAGLKETRTRITSIKTTRQVTSAMKMVSAAKLKRAQDAIIHFRPYANKLNEILGNLASTLAGSDASPYCAQREPENVLLVVISSNRGLCGGFNLNISRKVSELVEDYYQTQHENGTLDIITIGKQGERQLLHHGFKVVANYNNIWNDFNYDSIVDIAEEIMSSFADKHYDKVELVYNEFVNAASQIPINLQFLPVEIKDGADPLEGELMIYEPSKIEIANHLIPLMLKTMLYKAMLDSQAAEHGARMTAMHIATDNATELISELTLLYNKSRQAAITKEILEITAGAEALRS